MKKYIFKVVIIEGNDEFWEGLEDKSGCDDILEMMESLLHISTSGLHAEVKLVEFKDEQSNFS